MMMAEPQRDNAKRQVRIASIVILVTFPLWMAVSLLGGKMGLESRYAILADLAAMAAFLWALVVLFQVWRKRQRDEG